MKGAREVPRAEIERVWQEEAARAATLLKGKHDVEVRRLNELLEQSHLQNDRATHLDSQLAKEQSKATVRLSQVQVDAKLKIEGLLSWTTHLEGELVKMSEDLK